MSEDRSSRIAAYRDGSREADRLAYAGRKEQALALLRDLRDRAAEAGDEDYGPYFDAEYAFYETGDYPGAARTLQQALDWREQQGEGPDHFLLRAMGVYLSYQGDHGAGIEWLDQALKEAPCDSDALREKGLCLSKMGDEDAAIEWFDKALAENQRDWHTMRNKGVSLSKKGDEDAAIEWFDKALAENPRDDRAHREKSVTAFRARRFDEAFEHIARAAQIAPERRQDDFAFVCRATGRDFRAEWQRLGLPEPDAEPAPTDGTRELRAFILSIREAYADKAAAYLKRKSEDESAREGFLETESRLAPDRSLLLVLRRWNSYTPAVPKQGEERERGGGYFLWHRGEGTVIDPGFDFLANFARAGCRICDVHNIIVTHAHGDHTAELEALLTLLHEFNEKRSKDVPPHRVRLFLSNSALAKFSEIIRLRDQDYVESVHTLNPGWCTGAISDLRLRVLPAYHDDVLSRDQSVGLHLTLDFGSQEKRTLLFTGDTGLFPLLRDESKPTPDTADLEIWEHYRDDDGELLRPDLMLLHIGSVKETELEMNLDAHPASACYPNHLGIIGIARLITRCRPGLAVVSEFGVEMKDFRVDLIRGLQEKVVDKVLEDTPQEERPRILPGDLPFIYDIEKQQLYCCDTESWEDARKVKFQEIDLPDGREKCVHFCSRAGGDNREKAFRLWSHMKDHTEPYFR